MTEIPYIPGLEGVPAGITKICELDPGTGSLNYRGYDIHELARRSTFEETAYLLLMGSLPKEKELEGFSREIAKNRTVPRELLDFFGRLPKTAHPMDILKVGVATLGAYDPEADDNSHGANLRKAIRLMAKMPTITANGYRASRGLPIVEPDSALPQAENFLYMATGKRPEPFATRIFDASMILYAEHEYNASTFSARVTASTLSDMHSAVTSAIGTLKGALHGGANEQAMKAILEIGTLERAEPWVMDALAQKKRVMGFGHRIYKKGDSRAIIMKEHSRELGERMGARHWYQISERIEEIMAREKKLYPNVDFYSGIIYR
ncbi:MAG: citrate/2-methylcitrate synthase, partial [Candidatus Hydrothermarchaeota archaeon]